MEISILSPTLETNALGRAYLLAKLLDDDYRVNIIGHGNIEKIWEPVRSDSSVEYRAYNFTSFYEYANNVDSLCEKITGDLIYAVKPLCTSFGLALKARQKKNIPIILDIDDWEMGFVGKYWRHEAQKWKLDWFRKLESPLYTRILDKLTWMANAKTVSNTFLQKKYGGYWVPHARDESLFNPCSKCYEIEKKSLKVIFLGTARRNKGLDLLIDAWSMIDSNDASLKIIGTSKNEVIISELLHKNFSNVEFCGPVDMADVPNILADSDIIVIPQRMSSASVGQLPAKLLDAMAAAKVIVSTEVGDIPSWLADDAGIVVPPDSVGDLVSALKRAFDLVRNGTGMGLAAHERFLQYGSFMAVRPPLLELVKALISGRTLPKAKVPFS